MWLTITRPASIDAGAAVTIIACHLPAGRAVTVGDALLDLRVEIGSAATRDCPPVSTFRIIMQEDGWLSELPLGAGDVVAPGTLLALISQQREEPPAPPVREARTAAVAVLMHADLWS